MIKTAYANLHFVIDTLTPGRTYGFKVQARNKFGLSELSEEFSILCATVPAMPNEPETSTIGSQLTISWEAPFDSGSPLTGYKVFILASSGNFIEESVYCENNAERLVSRECTMPTSLLVQEPYLLALGDSVFAKVLAINFYGEGEQSNSGNGATCVLEPTKPINLQNNGLETSETQIGFSWEPGVSTGGRPILDWTIYYD